MAEMKSLGDMLNSFKPPEKSPEEWAAIREENARIKEREDALKGEERVSQSGIPSRYLSAKVCDCSDIVSDWSDCPTDGLLLLGSMGTGKTYSACAALIKAAKNGSSIKFTTMRDIITDCKATFNNRVSEKEVIAKYASVDMLCIDDVGKEQLTEWSLPIFFAIIDKRYSSEKPTIITTNYTGKDLMQKFTVNGDSTTAKAIVSRMASYTRVRMDGEDRRLNVRRDV